jgi:hypothetical protein
MKETLGQKQRRFTKMIAELILWAYSQGYEITVGDAYRDPRLHGELGIKKGYGHAKSGHKQRLAMDLNLFKDIDGDGDLDYLEKTEYHRVLGEKWESMGGSWGGRFQDGNHYSLEHDGVR